MSYNSRYFVDKEERKKKAVLHTEEMDKKYKTQIEESIKNSVILNDKNVKTFESSLKPLITVADMDTVEAAFKYKDGKTALLNFASYKNPGGMFIEGSKAQEECLCHASFLYNVLKEGKNYYEFNNKNKNNALYLNRAIYSPDIIFNYKGLIDNFDVLTCAAPNRSAFIKYNPGEENEKKNEGVLFGRIQFIHNIAQQKEVDTFILGAYGCGVFGQKAETVALFFKEILNTSNVKNIIFAVPSNMDKNNFDTFNKIFNTEKNIER